jgi:integrase
LRPPLGHLRPARVTGDQVVALIRKLERRALAASTIRSYLKPLAAIFQLAIRRGIVQVSPLATLTADERPQPTEAREHFEWSPESIGRLLEAAREADARPEARASYHPLIAFLVYTGARVGEALALRWGNVDLLSGMVRIRGTWSRSGDVTTPKTRAGRRDVPMPTALVDVLALAKPEDATDEDFVFAARHRRGPIGYWNFRNRGFAEVLKRAGFGGRITVHDLRHACASLLIAQGLPATEVAEHLGHRDATTTLRIYARLFDKTAAHARARAAFDVLEKTAD